MPDVEILNPAGAVSHHWQVDRRIPVATIVTLLGVIGTLAINIAYVSWWAATVQSAIVTFASRFDATDKRIEAIEKQSAIITQQGAQLGIVEVKVQTVQEGIKEVKEMLRERVPVTPK